MLRARVCCRLLRSSLAIHVAHQMCPVIAYRSRSVSVLYSSVRAGSDRNTVVEMLCVPRHWQQRVVLVVSVYCCVALLLCCCVWHCAALGGRCGCQRQKSHRDSSGGDAQEFENRLWLSHDRHRDVGRLVHFRRVIAALGRCACFVVCASAPVMRAAMRLLHVSTVNRRRVAVLHVCPSRH